MPGSVLAERYRIVRLVARGSMGLVYEANDVVDGSRVAVKVLVDEGSPDERALLAALFDVEVEALRRMDHPCAARLIAEGSGPRWLAMPFFDGERLGDALLHGPLPWARVVRVASSLCDALGAAHAAGIVHRDVKPSNVLLLAEDRVALLDFGVARLADRDDPTAAADPERVFGSPHTIAPEQVGRQPVDARTDVYGVGILMYRLLTGSWPFHGKGRRQTLELHLTAEPPPMRNAAPSVDVPVGLEGVVRRAMARMPDDRYASAAALRDALGGVVVTPAPPPSTGLAWLGAAAVLVVAVVWWTLA